MEGGRETKRENKEITYWERRKREDTGNIRKVKIQVK
jgi:hypothetical protein